MKKLMKQETFEAVKTLEKVNIKRPIIAKSLGISPSSVWSIVHCDTWDDYLKHKADKLKRQNTLKQTSEEILNKSTELLESPDDDIRKILRNVEQLCKNLNEVLANINVKLEWVEENVVVKPRNKFLGR